MNTHDSPLSQKQKMLAGQLYVASDPELTAERLRARRLLQAFNTAAAEAVDQRRRLLAELLGSVGPGVIIEPPFYCDYGTNIHLGEGVYFNFNCVILDVCEVRIGDRSLFGPAVQIYPATHLLDAASRAAQLEYGKPITVGADVWVGGGAVLCPGVTLGDRCVVAAGAVVTRDVPPDTLVGGNPARRLRRLDRTPG